MKLLLVTNDFPPRVGGIQRYLWDLYRRVSAMGVEVRVLAPAFQGDGAFDAAAGCEVVRLPAAVRFPTPRLERTVRALARESDAVAFGAVLPMNLIATRLERPVIVHTHGFEVAWARLPVLRRWLRRIADASSLVTVVSSFTERALGAAVAPAGRVELLRTGVDLGTFHPEVDASAVRARWGLEGRPVIACVSRLVARKGQDMLIRAMPAIRARAPDAALLLVGDGPYRARLQRMATASPAREAIIFTGQAPEEELPAHYAAGDVFAMPCRSRYGGLEVEGLGLVYLEAQACGRPAVTGDSGGAPEAVRPDSGAVVPGDDVDALAGAVGALLADPGRARAMGGAGRRFVEDEHDWDRVAARYRAMLDRL